jgi:uncharacterized membrane protein
MTAGYVLAPAFRLPATRRRRCLLMLGAALTITFVTLRSTNGYGDPASWTPQADPVSMLLSFVNCEKYPPSLLYLLMTLGPALMLLAALDGASGFAARSLNVIGRTPLLYYAAHLYFLHALAVLVAWSSGVDATWLLQTSGPGKPAGWGFSLPIVYGIAAGTVVALYPLCCWLGAVKDRRHESWWGYL